MFKNIKFFLIDYHVFIKKVSMLLKKCRHFLFLAYNYILQKEVKI